MCHINTREKIKTQADINNLIVGLINRQCWPFNEEEIVRLAEYHSAGAEIAVKKTQLERLIRSRLDTCERNDFLSYKKGYYYPKSIVNHI